MHSTEYRTRPSTLVMDIRGEEVGRFRTIDEIFSAAAIGYSLQDKPTHVEYSFKVDASTVQSPSTSRPPQNRAHPPRNRPSPRGGRGGYNISQTRRCFHCQSPDHPISWCSKYREEQDAHRPPPTSRTSTLTYIAAECTSTPPLDEWVLGTGTTEHVSSRLFMRLPLPSPLASLCHEPSETVGQTN